MRWDFDVGFLKVRDLFFEVGYVKLQISRK